MAKKYKISKILDAIALSVDAGAFGQRSAAHAMANVVRTYASERGLYPMERPRPKTFRGFVDWYPSSMAHALGADPSGPMSVEHLADLAVAYAKRLGVPLEECE